MLDQNLQMFLRDILTFQHPEIKWSDAGLGMERCRLTVKLEMNDADQENLAKWICMAFPLYPQCLWHPKCEHFTSIALGQLKSWNKAKDILPKLNVETVGLSIYGSKRFEHYPLTDKALLQEWSYLGQEGIWWQPSVEIKLSEDSLVIHLWRITGEEFNHKILHDVYCVPATDHVELAVSHFVQSIPEREQWTKDISNILTYLKQDIKKVVWARSQEYHFNKKMKSHDVLMELLTFDPTHYSFWHAPSADVCFMSHSPEKLFRRDGRLVEIDSLAGTCPVGETDVQSIELGKVLFNNLKERREQDIVTKSIVEVMTSLSKRLEVPDMPVIIKAKNVQHLFSPIRAQLQDEVTDDCLLEGLHPTPAMGGMPRAHAMEIIHAMTSFNRGAYAAPFGRFTSEQSHVSVGIRSLLLTSNQINLFAGCGIVEGSEADLEWEETSIKMRALSSKFLGKKIQTSQSTINSPTRTEVLQ